MDKRFSQRGTRIEFGVWWDYHADAQLGDYWQSAACYPVRIVREAKKNSPVRYKLYENKGAKKPYGNLFAICLQLRTAFRVARNHIQWRQGWRH